jgi:hypothetical protein
MGEMEKEYLGGQEFMSVEKRAWQKEKNFQEIL